MPVTRKANPRAKLLRRDMTRPERAFWYAVRDRQLGGFKIRRQVSVGRYVVDFLCAEARLIIELDGGQHTPEVDAEPTAALVTAGYDVVRFWNNEVNDNLAGVLEALLARLRR